MKKGIFKKFLTLALVVAVTATATVAGTLAYLTTEVKTKENKVVTVGSIDIELDEVVDVNAAGSVTESDSGAEYEGVMPGDKLIKEVTVSNTGNNDAYVRVIVKLNNADKINTAIDGVYEQANWSVEEIQAMYDYIFDGWKINYNPRPNAANVDDARGVIDGTYGLPEHVLHVDFSKTIKGSTVIGANNWFIAGNEKAGQYWVDGPSAYNGYYTKDMTDYEICYAYYLHLEPNESSTLFNGLNVPAEFNAEQLKMFESLQINVEAQAIQADNIPGTTDQEKVINAMNIMDHPEKVVSTNAALKKALTADEEHIVVYLGTDVTYDVAAWANNAMGGSNTKTITIYGNGNTLTFNQKDSDWDNVVTNNNAKLILNDLHLTSSGYNDGPWNRHDINFGCDVEMNNVTSDKAFAFKKNADLTNVTINDENASDTYAIWVQPNGQTVNLDNCVIDMYGATDGRGLKIDEQYVDAPQKVTLNVKNTTFKTEEKSAIIVKSSAGADINLENVDITGVMMDAFNEVWVDEASASHFDKVTVTGGNKILEPTSEKVSTNDELATAISSGNTLIELTAGTFKMPAVAKGKTLTLTGAGPDTIIEVIPGGQGEANGQLDYNLDGSTVTFNNLTIKTNNQTYAGYARLNAVYNNCVMENCYSLNGTSTFNDCVFNVSGNQYNIWTWGAPKATFNNCTFNSDGKAVLLYGQANTKLTLNDCTFNDTGVLPDLKAAVEIGNDYNKSYELIVNNVTVNGYEINDKGINTGTTLWGNKNSMGTDKLNVVVDGVDVY